MVPVAQGGTLRSEAGRMIVVVDDPDRENEGDLTIAAEMITPEAINFMASHGRSRRKLYDRNSLAYGA